MPSAQLSCRVPLSFAAMLMLAAALPPATALIKQTQLGDVDWLLQHVGEVQHARFAPRGPKVFVGTAAGVIACLHLRDGEILWRQVHTGFSAILHATNNQSLNGQLHDTQVSSLTLSRATRAPVANPSRIGHAHGAHSAIC